MQGEECLMKKIVNFFSRLFIKIRYIRDIIVYESMSSDDRFHSALFEFIKNKRKVLMMYGDCHMSVYGDYLYGQRYVRNKYLIVGEYDIDFLSMRFKKYIDNLNVWKKSDVFIFNPNMPVREDTVPLDCVKDVLKKDTRTIEISTACFKGYFPQHTTKKPVNAGLIAWGDAELNCLISNAKPLNNINELLSIDYYSHDKILKHWNDSIQILRLMEKNSDIKIADYLEQNGRKRVLFNSVTHPTVEIFRYIISNLLVKLGFDNAQVDTHSIKSLDHHSEVIYPSVYHHLGIESKWEDRMFQPGVKGTGLYRVDQYIDLYIKLGAK